MLNVNKLIEYLKDEQQRNNNFAALHTDLCASRVDEATDKVLDIMISCLAAANEDEK